MAVNLIEKKIKDYLPKLSVAQKKAVLTVVETFAEESRSFENIVNERFNDYETGKVKGLSLDELENKTRKAYKAKRNKK